MLSKSVRSASTYLRLLVGLLLALLAVIYLRQTVDYLAVWQALVEAEWWWVLGAVGCMLFAAIGLARRWQVLMKSRLGETKAAVSLFYILRVLLVGIMLNTLFPLRAGDITRAYIMGAEGRGRSFTMGTIVLEKVLDLMMLSIMFFLLLLQISLPEWVNRHMYSIVIGGSIIFITILSLLLIRQYISQSLVPSVFIRYIEDNNFLSQIWSRWISVLKNGLSSLDILHKRKNLLQLGVLSLLIWVIYFLTNVCVLWALQLDVPLVAALLVLVVLQLGLPLASVPGKIGVFEYLCVLSLSVFGVDETSALTFGILLHVVVLIPSMFGVFSFITLRGKR